ncbi:hypothetical protein G7046_g3404 [Stylonectria norvegica]|nr:hypothetical protein G7046_g3404 [Stylonectria norvegica]
MASDKPRTSLFARFLRNGSQQSGLAKQGVGPEKWSFGVLNDKETVEVPGSVLLLADHRNEPLGLRNVHARTSHSSIPAGFAVEMPMTPGGSRPLPPPEVHAPLDEIDSKKKTDDGTIILEPQPEESANDPLNWPTWRRDVALLSLGFYCMIGGGTTPIIAAGFTDVAETFNVELERVSLTTGLYMMGLGVGSVFASPTAILYGKRPVYLASAIVFVGTSLWAAWATSFNSLLIARVFQGMAVSPVECLPSATIAEIFFLHERAFRIGIYTLLLLGGKNIVPLVSAAIIGRFGWRWVFWIVAMIVGLCFVLLFLFVPETFWDRTPVPKSRRSSKRPSFLRRLSSNRHVSHVTSPLGHPPGDTPDTPRARSMDEQYRDVHAGFVAPVTSGKPVPRPPIGSDSRQDQRTTSIAGGARHKHRNLHVGFAESEQDEARESLASNLSPGAIPQAKLPLGTRSAVSRTEVPTIRVPEEGSADVDTANSPSDHGLSPAFPRAVATQANDRHQPDSPYVDSTTPSESHVNHYDGAPNFDNEKFPASKLKEPLKIKAYTHNLRQQPAQSFTQQLKPYHGRLNNDKWLKVMMRPFILYAYPAVLWSSLVYACSIGWLIVVSESIAMIYRNPRSYNFDALQTGLVYVSPFIGGILGTSVAGKLSDIIVKAMSRRNGGLYEPEFRLVMGLPVLITTCIGLMGFGWSAEEKDQWMVPTVFFGIISFGCSLGSTTAITFCVDSYRQYAGEALVTLNFTKNIFHGLVFSLFVTRWLTDDGPKQVYIWIGVIQLILMLFTIPMYIYGKRARMWTRPRRQLQLARPAPSLLIPPAASTPRTRGVVLVSFLRDGAFWRDGAGKLGLDLDAAEKAGRFVFVDGLTGMFAGESATGMKGRVVRSGELAAVQKDIEAAVADLRTTKKVLIIDQLDLLLATTSATTTSLALQTTLLTLRSLVHTTVLSVAADTPLVASQQTTLEREHASLVLATAHAADAVLALRMLDTGTARDVSGVVRVTGPGVESEGEWLYYVAADGGVRVFERGS